MILFITFWLLINIIGFFKRSSKIIFLFQVLFIFILLGWNTGGMDTGENIEIYRAAKFTTIRGFSSGWLYTIIAKWCLSRGYSFMIFNVIISGMGVIALTYVTLKSTKFPCLVAILFCIYPLIDSVIQKRFFPGMAFAILGFYFLQKENKTGFIISIILAVGFHFSFIVYFLFALWRNVDSDKQRKLIAIGFVVEVFLLTSGRNILFKFVPSTKITTYLYKSNYSSPLIGFIFMGMMAGYVCLFERLCTIDRQLSLGKMELATSFIEDMNLASIFIIPLIFLDATFFRFYRVILYFNYIYLAGHLDEFKFDFGGKIYIYTYNKLVYIIVAYIILATFGMYHFGAYGFLGYWNNMMDNYIITLIG